ncbi:hypothetical protein CHS0354_009904 [Potamilus streckersoni]|uniref:Rab-GAP TBC domain-containing protein n=1 Tax=Potamilus streckersoni TaxID=2493646 RepID=A0AAE0S4R4_9BIVA|nr:hypothetical protein CHS0354_009904 [Potamilus streckersoni]
MLNRLRSLSKGKLFPENGTLENSAENSAKHSSTEEILNAIDQFGTKITNDHDGLEDNNNLLRRGSGESSTSESWMEVDPEVEPTITSFSHSYSLEWEKLFTKPNYMRHLRNYAMKGNLRSSRFRSIAWKLFLEVLPDNMSQWQSNTSNYRQKYTDLKNKLIVNPRKEVDAVDLSVNNPLSQEEESPWNRFFQDNELRLTIKQDVIRTFPELAFFKSDEVREMMVNNLFLYSREHDHISYRQGMHELLAPIIFILHCDHQAFLHASEIESLNTFNESAREIITDVMDPKYLEHDAYAMFSQIMQTMEPWYVSKEVDPPKSKDSQPFARPQDLNPSNVIVSKLTRIQDYLLKKTDIELHQHLERLDIAPQIYGIRWIRLLFGRELPMQDLLVLWDAIFADGIGFDLVDYIFVAMLLYIRELLLFSDYPSCMNTLMRYPPVTDIHYFINMARFMRDPNQYPRPANQIYHSYATTASQSPKAKEQKPAGSSTDRARTSSMLTSTFSSFKHKMYSSAISRPKTLSVLGRQKMLKSSSEPMNLQTDISPGSLGGITPGSVPQHKRGSTASLSKVEDTMFRSVPSSGSLVTGNVRSVVSTPAGYSPDDISESTSPPRYATLPMKGKVKARKITQAEKEVQQQLAQVKSQIHDKEAMCRYCASKLDIHIERLQAELLQQNFEREDDIFVAIAGIKQVRDVLKGTLKFSQSAFDEEELEISENYYKPEVVTEEISQEAVKKSPSKVNGEDGIQKKKLFYMSSEENSENLDNSPDSPVSRKLIESKEFELEDYRNNVKNSPKHKNSHHFVSEPSILGSNIPKSQFSSNAQDGPSQDCLEDSPNPLYNLKQNIEEESDWT